MDRCSAGISTWSSLRCRLLRRASATDSDEASDIERCRVKSRNPVAHDEDNDEISVSYYLGTPTELTGPVVLTGCNTGKDRRRRTCSDRKTFIRCGAAPAFLLAQGGQTRLVEIHALLDRLKAILQRADIVLDCGHVLPNLQVQAQLDGDEQKPRAMNDEWQPFSKSVDPLRHLVDAPHMHTRFHEVQQRRRACPRIDYRSERHCRLRVQWQSSIPHPRLTDKVTHVERASVANGHGR